jgi:hypothetical protein
MPLRIIKNQGLRITKNSGASYMWRICNNTDLEREHLWWLSELHKTQYRHHDDEVFNMSLVYYLLASDMHGEFCESLCKVFVNSSIIIELLILWFLLSLDSPTNQMWRRRRRTRRVKLAKLQFGFKKPYCTFTLSMSQSFFHRTVFIHFFVQWASEEIEKV